MASRTSAFRAQRDGGDPAAMQAMEVAYRRTIDLQPGHAQALDAFGVMLSTRQRLQEALPFFQRAEQADPRGTRGGRQPSNVYALRRCARPSVATFRARRGYYA